MSVIYDQLRVSDNGQALLINAHVNKARNFDNVYMKRITICTEDQVSEINPLSFGENFIYQADITPDEEIEPTENQLFNKKSLNLVLTRNDFNEKFTAFDLSHNMFFVYIECEGTPTPDTPCRLDEMTTLGVTFDYGLMFNQAMNLTRELADTCNIPQNYLNFIMNYDALKLAIETEHYIPAINYWRNITGIRGVLSGNNTSGTVKPCGCYG